LCLIVWFWLLNKQPGIRYHFVAGLFIAISFLSLGYLITSFGRPKPVSTSFREAIIVSTVKDAAVRKGVKLKIIGESVDESGTGLQTLMIMVRDTDEVVSLLPGDRFLLRGRVSPLQFPVNPGGFDYNTFLRRKGISGIIYCTPADIEISAPSKKYRIRRIATISRQKLLLRLQKYAPSQELYAIAAALLIGYDDDLSGESRDDFSRAGAMHILCVSGLHVGIIFLILNIVLKQTLRKKKLRWLRYVLLLSGLWSYAFITGLSPSVMRATVMLSFVVTGNELERYTSVYNSISASALLLLFINPMLLFSIGFQLSYAAVIAIIALQKPIAALITPKNKILRKCWEILAVSIAAQAGTFALAAYYFHSFPTLFLITNLVVIPLASLILYTGIIYLALASIPVVSNFAGTAFYFLIDVLRRFTGAVAVVPHSAIHNINLSAMQTVIIAVVIISVTYLIYKGVYKKTKYIFAPVAALILSFFLKQASFSTQSRIVVYSDYRELVVEVFSGREAIPLYVSDSTKDRSFTVDDAHRKFGIRNINSGKTPEGYCGAGCNGSSVQFFLLGGKRIAVCEGMLVKSSRTEFPETDVLILKGINAPKSTEAICRKAKQVIITTNTYDYHKVQKCSLNRNIKHICTATDGACVISEFYLPLGRTITSIKTGR
jgi:competence protein ComEC